MPTPKIYNMAFAKVYPMYVAKAEKKGRTNAEVDQIIYWLTGYDKKSLQKQVKAEVSFETFFGQAPQMNPNVDKITGVVCGIRVENITERREQVWVALPSLVVVIDEFADLLDSYEYSWRAKIEKILKRFGQMARAAWVHMVLITQRATSQNIPGEIRTHFSWRIWFAMNSEADSLYLLDSPKAHSLSGPWQYLYKDGTWLLQPGYAPIILKEELIALKKSLVP